MGRGGPVGQRGKHPGRGPPTLWEDIDYRDGYRVIPSVITAGTAFAMDELGWWSGKLYKSKLAANVYTPEQYPAGWEKVSE